jgi:prefoldin alpha subunit
MADDAPEDPRRLLAQLEIVQRELERAERRMAALEGALMESQQAASTVRGMSERARPADALVPIGGGVHVRARVDGTAKLLLPIGAGYLTDATAAEALPALEARVKSITEQYRATAAEAEQLAQTAAALQQHLESVAGS